MHRPLAFGLEPFAPEGLCRNGVEGPEVYEQVGAAAGRTAGVAAGGKRDPVSPLTGEEVDAVPLAQRRAEDLYRLEEEVFCEENKIRGYQEKTRKEKEKRDSP